MRTLENGSWKVPCLHLVVVTWVGTYRKINWAVYLRCVHVIYISVNKEGNEERVHQKEGDEEKHLGDI